MLRNTPNVSVQSMWVDEQGSTLVELMVAMALLLTVTLPAGMFLGYMANYPMNQQKIEAFGIAQTTMEEMLQNKTFTQQTETEELSRGWSLKRERLEKDGWVHLSITVYRKGKPLVSLETVRLHYPEHE